MAYKSILTVMTETQTAEPALAQVIALAESQDAHAEALCLGVDRSQTGYYYAGANALIVQETLSRANTEAQEVLAFAQDYLGKSGVRWSAEHGVAQIADIGRHVAHRARFSDLVVLPHPYGKDRGAEAEPIIESAMFEGHCPVLVVPDDTPPMKVPRNVMIAWNESVEAMCAVRRALPFLKQAELARIVVIDPPRHGPDRSDPGGMLSQMLARHGVKCEIDVLSKTMTRVSDILNRHASDTESDLIVMGAYGHSRFREAILGGATRNMLEQSSVPVFLAH
ncbi:MULTISPECIES: universal stress protein [unclassified Ruegeria]|uniref:universal stress protein n=1 Tax=unclassified Ruegeria TaxID=2625375 RepID=UPI0014888C25|nr:MULTISPECIES: universal stress protein [unclassified Ruegeria]NOD32933.1 universal stress protein [Ruegeria sp. HKCCD7296]NOD49110.1 universal stress protein [Ruegeria sp. HKCCD5849]NOD51674.1 universal stress protein [Ruegeria sp. HKCCD5851]NOD68660.1 universal stress protein [Ruegeria sp. HKCCD7303]NOE34936.1 universal stress protein [Ruegeria sp. HKCCD7318]